MPSDEKVGGRNPFRVHANCRLNRFFVVGLFVLYLAPGVAGAEVILDGSLGPGGPLAGPAYRIASDLGQLRGSNLFHSFGKFNLSSTESATFSGPDTVANIIGRVTGGAPSSIDGLIRSEIPGANLFLLNPSGVMFGPNATLDVKGSFHASTADYLRLADGEVFYANPAASSVLTVASPSSFGFLGAHPAGISIQDSNLVVATGKTLSVVGGDITITSGYSPVTGINSAGSLIAPSGQIAITSVASPGEVSLIDFSASAFASLGDVTFQNAYLKVEGSNYLADPAGSILLRGGTISINSSFIGARGNPGGIIEIRGEQLRLDSAFVNTGTRGAADHPGTAVDIIMTGDVTFTNGSEIASSGYGSGRAGDVRIVADRIQLGDDDPTLSTFWANGFYGDIGSRAFSSGHGGNVEITSGSLIVKNGFFINTAAMSSGDAGNVTVRTGPLQLLDRGSISSNGTSSGTGGIVDIEAGDVLLSARNALGVPNNFDSTGLAAQASNSSNGGALRVTANNLQILDGAKISTFLRGSGHGANVEVTATNLLIGGVYLDPSINPPDIHPGIDARVIGTAATGTGGNVRVVADSIRITDGGYIRSNLFSNAKGNAGNIVLQAGTLDVSNNGGILTSSNAGTGNSGSLDITAREIRITGIADALDPIGNRLEFTGFSTATNAGLGGELRVTTDTLFMTDKGAISAASFGAGTGGKILVTTGAVELRNGATLVASASGAGSGGIIDVISDTVSLGGEGIVSSTSSGSGNAGNIVVQAGTLDVSGNGGILTSSTAGTGNSGTLDITAREIRITGNPDALDPLNNPQEFTGFSSATNAGLGGELRVSADSLLIMDKGAITASSTGSGTGGNVTVISDTVSLGGGGIVSSTSSGSGNAGNIVLQAGTLDVSNNGGILTSSNAGTGNSGSLDITAREIRITGIANAVDPIGNRLEFTGFSTATNAGLGGELRVTADTLFMTDKGAISAASFGAGTGGKIQVTTGAVELRNGATLVASASGAGPGGSIDVISDTVSLGGGASINASSTGTGNAGDIGITAGDSVQLRDASITTQASVDADGGNIRITAPFKVSLVDSRITSSVGGGPGTTGGNISIDPQYVVLKNSQVVANAFQGTGGNITIVADTFLSDPQSVVDASSALGVSGTVDIRAPISNVSGFISPLSSDMVSASALLRERCIARIREGKYSSFVVGGRDGLPIEPGNLMPSLPY